VGHPGLATMARRRARGRILTAVIATAVVAVLSLAVVAGVGGRPSARGLPSIPSVLGFAPPGASEQISLSPAAGVTAAWSPTGLGGQTPSPRQFYMMAYDPGLRAIVLFGGESTYGEPLGDTWEFANGHWTALNIAVSPTPRWAAGMAYDLAWGGVFLFGGTDGGTLLNDSWVFNATGWHELSFPYSPPPQAGSEMAYDSTDGYVLLTYTSPGTSFVNVWTFAGESWTNITARVSVRPPDVWSFSADDPEGSNVLYYGGSQGCRQPAAGTSLTWTYADGVFTNVTGQQTVTPWNGISTQAMAYDPILGGVVMFSSYTIDCVAVNATYLFQNGRWSNLTSSVGVQPPARWDARLVYLPGFGDVMFSGNEAPVGGFNEFGDDTWVLATTVPPPTAPWTVATLPYIAFAAVAASLAVVAIVVWRETYRRAPPTLGGPR
jgi:hypothetical protein